MKVDEFMRMLRQLVIEHPEVVHHELVLSPHGGGHRQHITKIHLNLHGTKVVIEGEQ